MEYTNECWLNHPYQSYSWIIDLESHCQMVCHAALGFTSKKRGPAATVASPFPQICRIVVSCSRYSLTNNANHLLPPSSLWRSPSDHSSVNRLSCSSYRVANRNTSSLDFQYRGITRSIVRNCSRSTIQDRRFRKHLVHPNDDCSCAPRITCNDFPNACPKRKRSSMRASLPNNFSQTAETIVNICRNRLSPFRFLIHLIYEGSIDRLNVNFLRKGRFSIVQERCSPHF